MLHAIVPLKGKEKGAFATRGLALYCKVCPRGIALGFGESGYEGVGSRGEAQGEPPREDHNISDVGWGENSGERIRTSPRFSTGSLR